MVRDGEICHFRFNVASSSARHTVAPGTRLSGPPRCFTTAATFGLACSRAARSPCDDQPAAAGLGDGVVDLGDGLLGRTVAQRLPLVQAADDGARHERLALAE